MRNRWRRAARVALALGERGNGRVLREQYTAGARLVERAGHKYAPAAASGSIRQCMRESRLVLALFVLSRHSLRASRQRGRISRTDAERRSMARAGRERETGERRTWPRELETNPPNRTHTHTQIYTQGAREESRKPSITRESVSDARLPFGSVSGSLFAADAYRKLDRSREMRFT